MTDEQIAVVHAVHKQKMPLRSITKEVKKSVTAVRNELIRKNHAERRETRGRPT